MSTLGVVPLSAVLDRSSCTLNLCNLEYSYMDVHCEIPTGMPTIDSNCLLGGLFNYSYISLVTKKAVRHGLLFGQSTPIF